MRPTTLFLCFIFCIFMGNTKKMFAQSYLDTCATESTESSDASGAFSYSTAPLDPSTDDPIVLNVFFWQVQKPDGSYGWGEFSEDKVLECIAKLNIFFNQYNIFFKYRGYDSFTTPANLPLVKYELVDTNGDGIPDTYQCVNYPGQYDPDGYGNVGRCQIGQFFNYAANNHKTPNAINIYVPYGSEFGGAARGVGSDMIILKADKLNSVTTTHEMGHALGLYHTRSKTNGCSNKEHTTRIATPPPCNQNDDYNAPCADDNVVDTAANTCYYHFDNGVGFCPYVNENCEYFGTEKDEDEVQYQIFPEDVKNAMSDAYCFDCIEDYLTPGQVRRMREKIGAYQPLINATTTVASLYEPYKGEYYVVGPLPPHYIPPHFQPGFEYRFVECRCECPEPADYNDISFYSNNNTILLQIDKNEQDYSTIVHPNHSAILIKHEIGSVFYPQARRCYENYNRKPTDGRITRFNDNVFNTNITVTPKDSLGINNPTLINTLDPGLYKIEENYQDGSTQQTVIFKEAN